MFKKQYFPDKTIESIAASEKIYNEGLGLFNDKKIKKISLNETNFSVEFTIQDDQEVISFLSFSKEGIAQKYSCDCVSFKKLSGACEHVVACMLHLNTINQETFETLNNQEVNRINEPSAEMMQLHKNRKSLDKLFNHARKKIENQTISFVKQPLKFEYVLNIHKPEDNFEYNMYVKIGINHLYVIQDVVEVAEYLLNEKPYNFGKQLKYDPKEHALLPGDRELLSYLYELGKDQENTLSLVHGGRLPERDGALIIPPQNIKDVLRMLIEIDEGYVRFSAPPKRLSAIDNIQVPKIEQAEDTLPLTINVTPDKDYFLLELESKNKEISIHPQANIIYMNTTFYFLTKDNFETASSLLEVLSSIKIHTLKLNHDDLASFFSLIYPKTKKMFNYIIHKEIKNLLYEVSFKPKIFLEYANNNLQVIPSFTYGNYEFNPLKTEEMPESEKVIVRDIFKEKDALNVLNHFFHQFELMDGKYVIDDVEAIGTFLYDQLIDLYNTMDIYLSKEVKALLFKEKIEPSLKIEINEKSNLLDVDFTVTNIDKEELPSLIESLQKDTVRFHKLSSGEIVDLRRNNFESFMETFTKLGLNPKDAAIDTTISLLQGLTIMNDQHTSLGRKFKEALKKIASPESMSFPVPKDLKATLRPYQEVGFKWMSTLDYYGLGGVLADDMGLGKTIQTITFILSKKAKVDGKYLIVCPSSVIYNWEREFNKFAPKINVEVISGGMMERRRYLNKMLGDENVDVLITSYPLIHRDISYYEKKHFKTIILDESQNVKNDGTKTTNAVQHLKSDNIFALSGTPVENNLDELWSLFRIVLPGLFISKKMYSELTETQIANRINMFILRRLKEDVLDDLPPKTETIEHIELAEKQKEVYQAQLSLIKKDVTSLINEEKFERNRMRVLAGLTRLRQISCDPRLVDPNYDGESAKLNRLMEYLEEAFVNNKRVVLFSQFTSMLAIIRDLLDKKNISYHYLDGSTPKKERLDLTTKFNEGDKDLFLISLRAGGTGLNLTGGDTVILYDSWWNPAVEDQAADRVHRFGQDKPVQVIRLIMKGTIEEGIYELQEKKRKLIDSVIHKNDAEENVVKLTQDDILKLLSN